MAQVAIENLVPNSPLKEPRRHFRFDAGGITNAIVIKRYDSSRIAPLTKPRKPRRQFGCGKCRASQSVAFTSLGEHELAGIVSTVRAPWAPATDGRGGFCR